MEVMEEAQSWIQQAILLQLFNEQLGVTSVVNGTDGVGRAGVLFAFRLAVMQLLEKHRYPKSKSLPSSGPKGRRFFCVDLLHITFLPEVGKKGG